MGGSWELQHLALGMSLMSPIFVCGWIHSLVPVSSVFFNKLFLYLDKAECILLLQI